MDTDANSEAIMNKLNCTRIFFVISDRILMSAGGDTANLILWDLTQSAQVQPIYKRYIPSFFTRKIGTLVQGRHNRIPIILS